MGDFDDRRGEDDGNAEGFGDTKLDAGVFGLDVVEEGGVALLSQQRGGEIDEWWGEVVRDWLDEGTQRRDNGFENGLHFD